MKLFSPSMRFLMLLIVAGVYSCTPDDPKPVAKTVADYSGQLAQQWNQWIVQADQNSTGFQAPVSARAFGYISLAAYEAAAPGMDTYKSVAGNFPDLQLPAYDPTLEYHWPTVLNNCYLQAVTLFFPTMPDAQKALLIRQANDRNVTFLDEGFSLLTFQRSKLFGEEVADAVFKFAETDAIGKEGYLKNTDPSYLAPVFPGSWQTTKPQFNPAILPTWGNARALVISDADKISDEPAPYSVDTESNYFAQMQELYNMSTSLTYEQQWMAEFWSDDILTMTFTPAARWVAVLNQQFDLTPRNLQETVYAYAMMGIALNDGGVASSNSQYKYNVERPVTYISNQFDENWKTHLNNPLNGLKGITPETPSYPSNHAVYASAAGEVLTDLFGTSVQFTDRCHMGRAEFIGTPRTFQSFQDMASEAAFSRMYEGVNTRQDCEAGIRMGTNIGQKVLAFGWRK
ncbi:MAG: vanadium-dependent haloperoxidase [Saprospiraceae bacterium]